MLLLQVLVVLFVLAVATGQGQGWNNVLPKTQDANDCNFDGTLHHQRRLFFKFRGLYDYRRYHQPDAKDDFTDRSGTVIFLNYQDEAMSLSCPCSSVQRWQHFGQGMEASEFNDAWSDASNTNLNIKAPRSSNYYRTYGCFGGNRYHYFNVFTRPPPETDFPVSFKERSTGTAEWRCVVRDDQVTRTNCSQQPFKIFWVLSDKTITPGENESVYHDKELTITKEGPTQIATFKDLTDLKVAALSTVKVVGPDGPHASKQAGRYECVVQDRNGLTSSFNYDSFDEENSRLNVGRRFGGFVDVHIREWYWVFVPIITIAVLGVLTYIFVWIAPDNLEEQIHEEEVTAIERAENERRLTQISNAPAEEVPTLAQIQPQSQGVPSATTPGTQQGSQLDVTVTA